jgi:hypothetical protein
VGGRSLFAERKSSAMTRSPSTPADSTAPCRWCGQTREGVRWDWYGKPPTCEVRPKWADESSESVIAREENLFEKVLDRAKKLAGKIDVAALTGEELARLHHTHGVDPSMLEVALMEDGRSLPQQLHDDYQRAYAEHRTTGKRGLVREIIVAKTAGSYLPNAAVSQPGQPPTNTSNPWANP